MYAIGDIHGRADLLQQLLDRIVDDNRLQPRVERQLLVFLGDYIDRGPETRSVIDIMTSQLPGEFDAIALKGNHEAMMLEAMENSQALPTWFHNGGQATLLSYGVEPDRYIFQPDATDLLGEMLSRNMPGKHKAFFRSLKLNATVGDYFFVHAGINPVVSLGAQKERDMLWIRQRFLQFRKKLEKIIIHGHTITASPEVRSNRIGIDTGAWRTGKLTAVRLQNREYTFLTT